MYVLGFDYGHQRIGVALGQTISRTASPLITLHRNLGPVWDAVEMLIQEWQPKTIVIGLPVGLDGEEQPITTAARQFSKTLENKFKKKYNLNFYFHDERYSSQAAKSIYNKNSRAQKPKNQKYDRNAFAAMLILESWLDSQT